MPELTREEKLELVEKLPQRLQDFLYSEDTGAFLLYIGEKYSIPDEKIGLLSKLVGDVILGIIPMTFLAQEINSKVISDPQASMHMAQELYSELLYPVMSETKPLPMPLAETPTPLERGIGAVPTPQSIVPTPSVPAMKPTPVVPTPKTDQYRESISGMPEIIDLRKNPPPQILMPVSPAPIPPVIKKIEPSVVSKVEPSIALPTPLIEAEPHKEEVKIPEMPKPPGASKVEPQFIIRPPGLAPTDATHNVLDLRKDKGEF